MKYQSRLINFFQLLALCAISFWMAGHAIAQSLTEKQVLLNSCIHLPKESNKKVIFTDPRIVTQHICIIHEGDLHLHPSDGLSFDINQNGNSWPVSDVASASIFSVTFNGSYGEIDVFNTSQTALSGFKVIIDHQQNNGYGEITRNEKSPVTNEVAFGVDTLINEAESDAEGFPDLWTPRQNVLLNEAEIWSP